MALFNCSAIYPRADHIEVWFDRNGRATIKRTYPLGTSPLPQPGQMYEEADISETAAAVTPEAPAAELTVPDTSPSV